ncbi:protein tyrosine phosphatase domain-containing protein 1-like isoform X2 [Ruditapes philippinarum]|uniref:protein tyrosine phosphatase domain-containing protein 1-like isoform X2 n=1 Tax=Ruditapes philippinarum TaxID=129788 RepID=UPI00295A8345|nr:protein tyrosine phosphatase domain-containing protein 1-like isoform X2 [Ruditapes philippinarum]
MSSMEPDPDEHQYPGEEDIKWDDESIKGNKPKGLYSKTSETARGFISTEKQCALFCGGKKCKYCSGEGWEEHETVINGLYSQWVTDNILAMARPSNLMIEKQNLVQKFLDADIKSIVNLQMAGEHAECGPHKLDPSGFLYNPQAFMEKGIFFYNFGWPDYGVASLSTILDMVKVMQFAMSQGKVAVHCHAGRGRTGVIIACYLVFTNRISGREAIHYVREKRPNSIQTRQQMQVIQEFEQYLKPFRVVYASRQKGSHEFSLQQFLNRQRHILHGYEARRLKHIPKIIYTVCERLLELAKKGSSLRRQFEKNATPPPPMNKLQKTFSTLSQTSSSESKTPVQQSSSKDLLTNGKRRYKRSLLSARTRTKSISMEDLTNEKFLSVLDDEESLGSSNSGVLMKTPGASDEEDDDDSIIFGNSTVDLKSSVISSSRAVGSAKLMSQSNGRSGSPGSENTSVTGTTNWSIDQSLMTADMSEDHVQAVGVALSATKVEDYVKDRARDLQKSLNETDNSWTQLSTEGDAHVLGLLLWDWLDQLKEPVLRVQDLSILLNWIDEPLIGVQKVERGTRHTIEYLVKVISKLKPLNEQTVLNLYEKLLSHLTHQWVSYDSIDLNCTWAVVNMNSHLLEEKEHWGVMKTEEAEKLFQFFHNLQTELSAKHRASKETLNGNGSGMENQA